MKKIFHILLVACAMVSCSKSDEPPIINSLEDMYGTLWLEHSIHVQHFNDNGTLFDEYTIPETTGAVGAAFAHYYINNSFVGYLIKRYPNVNDREFPVYYIKESTYQLDSSNKILKIGDDTYSLIEFTPSRIKWELTTYFDKGYSVYTTTLLPDNSQDWGSMVEAARAENKRFIEQYDNYTPAPEKVVLKEIESMLGTSWQGISHNTSIHYDNGKVITYTKDRDSESTTYIYHLDKEFVGRFTESTSVTKKDSQYSCEEFAFVAYDATKKSLKCTDVEFTLTQFNPEVIEWSYVIEQGDGYVIKANETLQPYQGTSWSALVAKVKSENGE